MTKELEACQKALVDKSAEERAYYFENKLYYPLRDLYKLKKYANKDGEIKHARTLAITDKAEMFGWDVTIQFKERSFIVRKEYQIGSCEFRSFTNRGAVKVHYSWSPWHECTGDSGKTKTLKDRVIGFVFCSVFEEE